MSTYYSPPCGGGARGWGFLIMEKITDKVFGGERPLFEIHNVELDHVRITFGESGIKECSNIVCRNCYFEGKYPLWHVKGSDIRNCYFAPGSRSAI